MTIAQATEDAMTIRVARQLHHVMKLMDDTCFGGAYGVFRFGVAAGRLPTSWPSSDEVDAVLNRSPR